MSDSDKTPHPAVSRVELEPALLNTLLALYANKPDGPQLWLEDGHLKVMVSGHAIDVNPIGLEQVAQVMLKAGQLGDLKLAVENLNLDQNGLQLQLRLKP